MTANNLLKAFMVVENYNPNLDSMSGTMGTLFYSKELALKRLGTYRRNQDVRILEIDIYTDKDAQRSRS